MHDPLVVAWEIPAPVPVRKRWRDATRTDERRWTLGRARRTNPENLGQPVYPWWRPRGYSPRLAGRTFGLARLVTVWHREPGGADALTVCRDGYRDRRWKWHVHHWHLQVHPLQRARRVLLTRCEHCERRGSPNISTSWYPERAPWWRGERGLLHHECHSLISAKRCIAERNRLIRSLAVEAGITLDKVDDLPLVPNRTDDLRGSWTIDWAHRRTLRDVLGEGTYEWAKS